MITKRVADGISATTSSHDPSTSKIPRLLVVLNYACCVPVLIFVGLLSFYHFYRLLTNTTSIEAWEKDNVAILVRRGKIHEIKYPYDLGTRENIRVILGSNPLLWWWPTSVMGDGLRFLVAEATDRWPHPGNPIDLESLIDSVSPVPVNVSGHFGDLFQGVYNVIGKVALKRPRIAETAYGDDVIRRFEREAETWKQLRHPHILQFLGTLKRDGHVYLVSPFINNGTLVEYLFRNPDVGRVRLLRETADAIRYLHSQNVVHGDIKGTNILVSDDAHVLLCDFGLAKTIGSNTSGSVKGAGSLRWMSPELWDNEPRTFASDVYAFGMTIAEVLAGKEPFAHLSNPVALVVAVKWKNERPVKDPVLSPNGESYEEGWNVAAACWPTNPSERISMAEAFHRLTTGHLSVEPLLNAL